jgi:phenylacetate-CoA ligase
MDKWESFYNAKNNSSLHDELYSGLDNDINWDEVPIQSTKFRLPPIADLPILKGFKGRLCSTGGSREPAYIPISYKEFDYEGEELAKILKEFGLSEGDAIIDLTHTGNLAASFLLTNEAIKRLPVIQLPILGDFDIASFRNLSKLFPRLSIIGLPGYIDRLAYFLLKEDIDIEIDKIFFAGDLLYDSRKRLWEEAFPGVKIISFLFASVDCGFIGKNSPKLGPSHFEVISHMCEMEILDENNEVVTETDKPGKIVVTNLYRKYHPIVRNNIGDMAKWVNYEKRIFKLLGRDELSLRLGLTYRYYEVRDNIEHVLDQSFQLQMQACYENSIETLIIKVFTLEEISSEQLAEKLKDLRGKFYESFPGGLVRIMVVSSLKELKHSVSSGKLIPIMDLRTT